MTTAEWGLSACMTLVLINLWFQYRTLYLLHKRVSELEDKNSYDNHHPQPHS